MKNKITKILLCIVVLIILILVINFARKLYLINKIMAGVEKNNNIAEYYVVSNDYEQRKYFVTDGENTYYAHQYNQDNQGATFIETYMFKDEHTAYTYYKRDNSFEKTMGVLTDFDNQLTYGIYEEMSFTDKVVAALTWKVGTEKINGKKYYHICKDINKIEDGQEYEFWLEKETFLKIKSTVKENFQFGEPEKTIYYIGVGEGKINDFNLRESHLEKQQTYTEVKSEPIYSEE